MLGADLAQALQIALRRDDDAGRSLHRFDDHGGDGARIVQRDDALEVFGEMQAPIGLTSREPHLRGVPGVRQMVDARDHERREHLAVGEDAAHRDAAHADAVVAALAADDAGPRGLPACTMVGDRDLEGGVDRLGPGVDEEDLVVRASGERGDALGEGEGSGMAHLEARREIERRDLLLHGFDDPRR